MWLKWDNYYEFSVGDLDAGRVPVRSYAAWIDSPVSVLVAEMRLSH